METVWRRAFLMILAALMLLTAWTPAVAESSQDSRVTEWLAAKAEEQKDPWAAAILRAGAKEISWDGQEASFLLRGYDPKLKELGAYFKTEDKAAWRAQAAENYDTGLRGGRHAAEKVRSGGPAPD